MNQDVYGMCIHGENMAGCQECKSIFKNVVPVLNSWINTKDSTPNKIRYNGCNMLAMDLVGEVWDVCYDIDSDEFYSPNQRGHLWNVTHWMLLSKPSK
jgi:hypothetical protein